MRSFEVRERIERALQEITATAGTMPLSVAADLNWASRCLQTALLAAKVWEEDEATDTKGGV